MKTLYRRTALGSGLSFLPGVCRKSKCEEVSLGPRGGTGEQPFFRVQAHLTHLESPPLGQGRCSSVPPVLTASWSQDSFGCGHSNHDRRNLGWDQAEQPGLSRTYKQGQGLPGPFPVFVSLSLLLPGL